MTGILVNMKVKDVDFSGIALKKLPIRRALFSIKLEFLWPKLKISGYVQILMPDCLP
jgi:hypothetical protein